MFTDLRRSPRVADRLNRSAAAADKSSSRAAAVMSVTKNSTSVKRDLFSSPTTTNTPSSSSSYRYRQRSHRAATAPAADRQNTMTTPHKTPTRKSHNNKADDVAGQWAHSLIIGILL